MLPDAILVDGSNISRKRPRSSSKRSDSGESSPKRATSEGPSLISESGKNPSRDEMAVLAYGQTLESSADNAISQPKRKDSATPGWRKHSPEEKLAIFSSQVQHPLKIGDSWFIISMKWLNDWQMACKSEISKEGVKEESTLGPVDNSSLLDEDGFFKIGLLDEVDYRLVPKSMWDLFVEWYGPSPHTLQRTVVPAGRSEQLYVECFIPRLKVYRLRPGVENGITGQGQPAKVEFSLRRPAKEFLNEICGIFGSKPDSTRIYRVDMTDDSDGGSEYSVALLRKSEHTLLNIDPNDSSTALSDLQVNPLDHIVVEIKEGMTWPSSSQALEASSASPSTYPTEPVKQEYTFKSGGFFEEVSSRLGITSPSRPGNGQTEASSLLKPALNLINKVKQASSSSKTPGLLGLGNLGNTCFMNSALQCLAHNEELTEYFLTELYREELNRSNPLGMGGEIAESYGALLSRIWSSSGGSSYSPREFKQQLQRFAPQFSGYQQHDSQEFLAFLLDGLHEDLNRVLQKPYVTNPDWEGGGDKELIELAKKSWEGYVSRNDSAIVDLFQGQYKSTLVCPECHKISITFDPFMYLTLPLPVKKKWHHDIYFIPWDTNMPHIKIPVEMNNDLSFKDLRRLIGRWTGTNAEHLVTLEIFQHRFYRYLDDNTTLSDVNSGDHVACYELPWKPRANDKNIPSAVGDHLVIPIYMASRKPRGYYSPPDLIGHPFLLALTAEEACSDYAIYSALVERIKRWTKNAQYLYKYNGVHRSSDTHIVPILRDSEPPVPLTEIREDGEVVITTEMDGVDISEVKTLEDDPDVGTMETLPTPVGPQSDLFDMDLYHFNNPRFGLEASYNMKKVSWNERRDGDGPLLIPGDVIVCKWEENFENYFFKEYASWNAVDFQEYIHPEYDAARKAASTKPVDLSLEDCLDEFTKEERLGEDDPWYCPRCKKHQQATKNMQIWKAPDVLVVHLKRFSNSRILRDKIDAFINFPLEGLDLETRVGERLAAKALLQDGYSLEELDIDVNERLIYDLFGVDEHIGDLGGGHYRAYAKNHINGEWYHFNDTIVTKCRASESVNRNAYLLFYRRRATHPLGGKTYVKIQEALQIDMNKDVLLPTPPDEKVPLAGDEKSIALPSDNMSMHSEPWTPSLNLPLESISASSSPPALEDGDLTPGLDSTFTDALDRSNSRFSMPSRGSMFDDRMGSPVSSSSNEAENGGSDEDISSPSLGKGVLGPANFTPSSLDDEHIMNWDVDTVHSEFGKSGDRWYQNFSRLRTPRNGLPSPEPEEPDTTL